MSSDVVGIRGNVEAREKSNNYEKSLPKAILIRGAPRYINRMDNGYLYA